MDAKIKSQFWRDERVGILGAPAKLAFLWCMTNSGVNVAGATTLNKRQFEFDTGLDVGEVLNLCWEHPSMMFTSMPMTCPSKGIVSPSENKGIVSPSKGIRICAMGFIGHQFGRGDRLTKNRIFSAVLESVESEPDALVKQELLGRYPEIQLALARGGWRVEGHGKGIASPSKGIGNHPPPVSPCHGVREREGEGEGERVREGEGKESFPPVTGMVLKWCWEWPGDMATGTPGWDRATDEKWIKGWVARVSNRVVGWPGDWRRAIVADWCAGWGEWRAKKTAPATGAGMRTSDRSWWWTSDMEALRGELAGLMQQGETDQAGRLAEIINQRSK